MTGADPVTAAGWLVELALAVGLAAVVMALSIGLAVAYHRLWWLPRHRRR